VNYSIVRAILGSMAVLIFAAGCKSKKPLLLESNFRQIKVGQSDATEVLNLLPEKGMLHTAGSVSVYSKHGWAREAGIVQFSTSDSTVVRKDYVQVRSHNTGLLTQERLLLYIEGAIGEDILEEPYESDTRKHLAILRHCHESLINDAKPFNEDQSTLALIGMGRAALNEGIVSLSENPRRGHEILSQKGYAFVHSVLGRSRLRLSHKDENIFTVSVTSEDWVDMFNTW